ncbi:hypothetical protein B0H14DRAFT_492143 [Mycena olivaceomarginata]|nr:hypothetical protein B0H14DRAFT_492143 [Mycena olivaceomarginata]
MYPSSPPAHVFPSRSLGPLRSPRLSSTAKRTTTAMCTRHSFPASMVSSGYLLDSYALCRRHHVFNSHDSSVPLRCHRRSAALRPQRPPCAIQRCLLLALTSRLLLLSVLSFFRAPSPRVPTSFLQTKIIVVLAIHLPTDSYPRRTSMPLSH